MVALTNWALRKSSFSLEVDGKPGKEGVVEAKSLRNKDQLASDSCCPPLQHLCFAQHGFHSSVTHFHPAMLVAVLGHLSFLKSGSPCSFHALNTYHPKQVKATRRKPGCSPLFVYYFQTLSQILHGLLPHFIHYSAQMSPLW